VFFIHHVAKSIQLPEVIASIGRDLAAAVDAELADGDHGRRAPGQGPSEAELLERLADAGATVHAPTSGYLQFVAYPTLVDIAAESGAVIRMLHRPGHFLVAGLPLAEVWPAPAAEPVARALERAHATGAHRTLSQDLAFAIDQLVEIAIRALSPAVNDTFSALTCIDWLGDGLCRISARWVPVRTHRDASGHIRVISAGASYTRLVDRSFDKIRQAGRGMPAVLIRQLDAIEKVMAYTTSEQQRAALVRQAEMIRRASEESIPEPADRADVDRRYEAVVAALGRAGTVRYEPATP
jgi:uncharacterized membrane protein